MSIDWLRSLLQHLMFPLMCLGSVLLRQIMCGTYSGLWPLLAPLSLFAVQEMMTQVDWGWQTEYVWLVERGALLMPATVAQLLSGRLEWR